MLREQLAKRSGIYNFSVEELRIETAGGRLPLLSASIINGIRRLVAEDIDALPCRTVPLAAGLCSWPAAADGPGRGNASAQPLMRSKYCVRYDLGLCPKYQGAQPPGELFLLNNGRRLALHFDCSACEMTVTPA